MKNQIQIASEAKNSNHASTLAHETRKNRQGLAILLIFAIFSFTGCGSGSGSGGGKSGLSVDGFFGALPAIFADHELAYDAARANYKAEAEKATQAQNLKAYQKAEEKWSITSDDLSAKFEAAVKAELAKLNDKDVPYTVSEDFNDFKISSLKIDETGNLKMSTSDVKRNLIGIAQFRFRALAKDGSVILDVINYGAEQVAIGGSMRNEPAKWVNFEKIEFVGRNE